jgi:hypothetical protein
VFLPERRVKLVIAIGSAFFALLGVLTALDEWAQHAKKPRRWFTLDRQRRAFLTLSISALWGMIGGSFYWFTERREARVRDLLFDLEVLLAQLDGLVASALVQGNVHNSLAPIRVLVGLIGRYGFRAADILSELKTRLSDDEYDSLKRGAMAITFGLEVLEMPRAPDSGPTVISALVNMQSGIRLARSQVRHLINERVLQ